MHLFNSNIINFLSCIHLVQLTCPNHSSRPDERSGKEYSPQGRNFLGAWNMKFNEKDTIERPGFSLYSPGFTVYLYLCLPFHRWKILLATTSGFVRNLLTKTTILFFHYYHETAFRRGVGSVAFCSFELFLLFMNSLQHLFDSLKSLRYFYYKILNIFKC